MRAILLLGGLMLTVSAQTKAPKIWDDKALEDWATPIAALGIRPAYTKEADYYAVPGDNLKTYPVYRPDREPPGYWEWLHQQKPQPLVDVSKIQTHEDWIKAGKAAFQAMDEPPARTSDPAVIQTFRNPEKFEGLWTQTDGSIPWARWVVTKEGVQVATAACPICHVRMEADGSVDWTAGFKGTPGGKRAPLPMPIRQLRPDMVKFPGDSDAVSIWRQYTVPWAPDERVEQLRNRSDAVRITLSNTWTTFPRTHGSPFYASKIPDLSLLRFSRYLDATGTHRLRGPEDVARYAAFVMGADPMKFGRYEILEPRQQRITFRFADETLYAIGVYLMSVEPAHNPNPPAAELAARGRVIFRRETCVECHVPPNYTSGKLTLAQGFTPPADHPNQADIFKVSVGTDPGLAMRTRKGTGFYKIPSLRGVWHRSSLLHDGSVASLEEMFDPERVKADHVPGGWKGSQLANRGIPGHPFGLGLNDEDKKALLAFLRSL
jgi:hypothetical protein